jgi:hypothetical protein
MFPLPLLFSVLALLICVFSFFYFKYYLKRRTGQERILSEFREEVNSILRLINETTDRDISLVEEREKILKTLLDETEKRIKVYVREFELRKEAENSFAALSEKKTASTYGELGKNRYRPSAFPVPEVKVEPAPENLPFVSDQIRSLVLSGISAQVIASRLGVSIAEVEFAAALLERSIDTEPNVN